jgi:hypothetical protein
MRSKATGVCSTGGGASRRRSGCRGTVEKVLGLYRDKYFDLNVRHFHEKLRESTRSR